MNPFKRYSSKPEAIRKAKERSWKPMYRIIAYNDREGNLKYGIAWMTEGMVQAQGFRVPHLRV